MSDLSLYRGLWPQNVSKLAKYAVRSVHGEWRITVLYEAAVGLRYLAVEGGGADLVSRVNAVKSRLQAKPGGVFYVNEFRHVLVPVVGEPSTGATVQYYCAGRLLEDFRFEYEGRPLATRPVAVDGKPLEPGASWEGPRPGIPYVLAAGGGDIYYETPALSDADPPRLMVRTSRRVELSKTLGDRGALARAVRPIAKIRGHHGGRFYVNEHGVMFTPVSSGDGNGLEYVYCGQIDHDAWFPEPPIEKGIASGVRE